MCPSLCHQRSAVPSHVIVEERAALVQHTYCKAVDVPVLVAAPDHRALHKPSVHHQRASGCLLYCYGVIVGDEHYQAVVLLHFLIDDAVEHATDLF